MPSWTRRQILTLAGAAALARPALARGEGAPRVAALDWTLASTLIGLGTPPVGVAEQALYRDWVRTPEIPSGTVELGLRIGPSFETLAGLKPDFIAINPLNAGIRPRLETIAPILVNAIFSPERTPLRNCRAMTRAIAERIDARGEAEALIDRTDAALAEARQRLAGVAARPLLPLNVLDARHLSLYGRGSLYVDVLQAVGLVAGFDGPTSPWGNRTVGIEALARVPPCDVLVIGPVPPAGLAMVEGQGLWSSLLAAKGARQIMLPPAWAFGDLLAAVRFADNLAEALTGERVRPR